MMKTRFPFTLSFSFSRAMLFAAGVMILSRCLPVYYAQFTQPAPFRQSAAFSVVTGRCVLYEANDRQTRYSDENGTPLTYKEQKFLRPFRYCRDLNKWGHVPFTVKDKTLTLADLTLTRTSSVSPQRTAQKPLPIGLILESSPEGASFTLPETFFIVRPDKLALFNPATKTYDTREEARLNGALQKAGVAFPLLYTAGNPSVYKPFDDGNYLVDQHQTLWQVKKVRGDYVVKKRLKRLPGDFLYLSVAEHTHPEYTGIVATETGLYLLTPTEPLRPLIVPGYRAGRDTVRLRTTALFRTATLLNPTEPAVAQRLYTEDLHGQLIHRFTLPVPERIQKARQQRRFWQEVLVPFPLGLTAPGKLGYRLFIGTPALSPAHAFFALLWALAYAAAAWVMTYFAGNGRRKRQTFWRREALSLCLVFVLGAPGFIALLVSGPFISLKRSPRDAIKSACESIDKSIDKNTDESTGESAP